MNDLKGLYQQLIIEHNKNPRNYGNLNEYTHHSHGINPLCGDDINLKLVIDNNTINDIRFTGHGCAISQASGSLMTTHVKGKSIDEAKTIITQFREMIYGNSDIDKKVDSFQKLKIFQNISNLPNRVKCVMLPWATLYNALCSNEITSTE